MVITCHMLFKVSHSIMCADKALQQTMQFALYSLPSTGQYPISHSDLYLNRPLCFAGKLPLEECFLRTVRLSVCNSGSYESWHAVPHRAHILFTIMLFSSMWRLWRKDLHLCSLSSLEAEDEHHADLASSLQSDTLIQSQIWPKCRPKQPANHRNVMPKEADKQS